MKPILRDRAPVTLGEIPFAPAFEAGYLTDKNDGWRSQKPVIVAENCNGCNLCYLYCPDGVIRKENGIVAVDYDFCKGCGICKKICKRAAIVMESEK